MPDVPRKETISSRISGLLRDAILRGDLAPGSKINLDRLRAAHDISISPLREAVARLVADGLVEFEDQRGYRVAGVSAGNLSEIIMLRAELDVLALRHSIERGDLDWESGVLRTLYVLNRTRRDPSRSGTLDSWNTAHREFHTALISGCNMPLLLGQCAVLHNMNNRYHRLYPGQVPRDDDTDTGHEVIATAATARDAERACAALRAHVLGAGAALAQRMAAGSPAQQKRET